MAESNNSEFHVKELNRYCRVRAGVVYIHLPRGNEQNTPAKFRDRCRQRSAKHTSKSIFCLCCHHTAMKATQYSECTASTLKVFQWTQHTELGSSCEVCCFFKKQKKGGRPKRERKNCGRPHSQHVVNRILLHATHI